MIFIWKGKTADVTQPGAWFPAGVPAQGDIALITHGTAEVTGIQGASYFVGSLDQYSAPSLLLEDGSAITTRIEGFAHVVAQAGHETLNATIETLGAIAPQSSLGVIDDGFLQGTETLLNGSVSISGSGIFAGTLDVQAGQATFSANLGHGSRFNVGLGHPSSPTFLHSAPAQLTIDARPVSDTGATIGNGSLHLNTSIDAGFDMSLVSDQASVSFSGTFGNDPEATFQNGILSLTDFFGQSSSFFVNVANPTDWVLVEAPHSGPTTNTLTLQSAQAQVPPGSIVIHPTT